MKIITTTFLLSLITILFISSCKEDKFYEGSEFPLTFSTDTIMFDTVFTTIGTTTKSFTVINKGNTKVRLKSVSLAKGDESNFAINVDGLHGPTVYDIEIEKNDSIYIFVEANIDPDRDEMVEKDSIVFNTGNSENNVKVVAFGQDVNLISGEQLTTQTWTSEKPYLIYNYAQIMENNTLTIQAGTSVFFHYAASLIIDGTLDVQGALEQPVTFRSDRLEPFYEDKPGQWGAWIELENGSVYLLGGLHFTKKSSNNHINFAIIQNAIKGIQLDSVQGGQNPGLTLKNTIIQHMNVAGIVAQTSSIEAHNLVINNCGMYALALLLGGNYWFNHSTIANYTTYTSRSTPAVIINNYYKYDQQTISFPLQRCLFSNSIIHGRKGISQSEVGFDLASSETGNYMFDHCILQLANPSDTLDATHFRNIIFAREGVSYKDIGNYNFDLDTLSPAKDKGLIDYTISVPTDIAGRSRTADTKPDLGAFERNEKK